MIDIFVYAVLFLAFIVACILGCVAMVITVAVIVIGVAKLIAFVINRTIDAFAP